MFRDGIEAKSNVFITARERGKKVAALCRESHNVWVNNGRQYLAEVISPTSGFAAHYNDSPIRVVQYMALGIGGDEQTADISVEYPTLDTHYPGLNTFDDDSLTTPYLERPIKVTGVAGVGTSAGVWMNDVVAPPDLSGVTVVEFQSLFSTTDLQLGGSYPAVPLSEIGLMLSIEEPSRTSEEVYDYAASPWINTSSRQQLIAYNTFATITKTASVALEIHWEIQF